MSKAALLEKLTDKSYRDAFLSEEIDVGLPMQLRAMREARGWKQSHVAEKTGTKQPRFSLMEKPGYGKFSLNTLKKLAALFDVGLVVSFVPFSEMIDFVEGMGPKRLTLPSFAEEYMSLQRRFSRDRRAGDAMGIGAQATLDFAGLSSSTVAMYDDTVTVNTVAVEDTPIGDVDEFEAEASTAADLDDIAGIWFPHATEYDHEHTRLIED